MKPKNLLFLLMTLAMLGCGGELSVPASPRPPSMPGVQAPPVPSAPPPSQPAPAGPSEVEPTPPLSAARALVVFVGGAADSLYQNMLGVYEAYRAQVGQAQLVHYARHDQQQQIVQRIQAHLATGGPVCLVGHSWGGDAALDVVNDRPDLAVALVVTLDGVSTFSPRADVSASVDRWVNVYVDVSAPGTDNLIASLGGHWGHRAAADLNVDFGRTFSHAQAAGMFSAPAPGGGPSARQLVGACGGTAGGEQGAGGASEPAAPGGKPTAPGGKPPAPAPGTCGPSSPCPQGQTCKLPTDGSPGVCIPG